MHGDLYNRKTVHAALYEAFNDLKTAHAALYSASYNIKTVQAALSGAFFAFKARRARILMQSGFFKISRNFLLYALSNYLRVKTAGQGTVPVRNDKLS